MVVAEERPDGGDRARGRSHLATPRERIQPDARAADRGRADALARRLLWPLFSRYLGRLPGDIVVRRPGFTLVFPIATSLILSLLLTLLLWLFRR